MNRIELTGLDGRNPLAYFAALGLLRVVDEAASQRQVARPRLAFVDRGEQRPFLESTFAYEEVVALVLEDAARWEGDVVLSLCYDGTRDLKPPPDVARATLSGAASSCRLTADLGAAFFSEFAQDTEGKTKPTAFHFTAGNQKFLLMVEELRGGLTAEGLQEALVGPWDGSSELPSLTWEPNAAPLHALRAKKPRPEERSSIPAANWLGVIGLTFFPVVVVGKKLATTAVVGDWKDSVFTWPLWSPFSTAPTIAALLRTELDLTASSWRAVGIAEVCSSRILRSDRGGYGTFSPVSNVHPRRKAFRTDGGVS